MFNREGLRSGRNGLTREERLLTCILKSGLPARTTSSIVEVCGAAFDWCKYEDTTLSLNINTGLIVPLVDLLVVHTPEDLLVRSLNSIKTISQIMHENNLDFALESLGLNETNALGPDEETPATWNGDTIHDDTVPNPNASHQTLPAIPFATGSFPTSTSTGPTGNKPAYVNKVEDSNKFGGLYGVTGRSQLGQLLDPTGKGVSQ